MNHIASCLAITVALPLLMPVAHADEPDARLTIRNHRFEPEELHVPAGRKIRLLVTNLDASAEEFESHELNREKVIPGSGSASLYLGPLAPGRYPFIGEFHESSARGSVVAE
jgi:plastocyanin